MTYFLTPRNPRSTALSALVSRVFTRMSDSINEFRSPALTTTPVASETTTEPTDLFTTDDMPAVEDIDAAAREFNRATDQARRADRGKRAAKKVLDRLPVGTYGAWLVERIPSTRQTADLDEIRAIFKANGLGPVPMKTSAPSLKLTQVPVTGECARCERTWEISDLSEDGNGDKVCVDCHSSDTSAEDAHAARSYYAGV